MSCERVRRQLGVYRELDRIDRRAVDQHLRACEGCRTQWQDEQRVRSLVRSVPLLDVPRGLEGRLLAIPAAPPPRLGPPRLVPWLLLATASLLAGGLMVVSRGPGSGGAQPPGPMAAGLVAPIGQAAADERAGLAAGRPAATALLREHPPLDQAELRPAERVAFAAPPSAPRPPAPRRRPKPEPAVSEPALLAMATEPPPSAPVEDPEPAPRQPATALPLPTAAPVCVDFVAELFVDLAGGDPAACPACDGQWSEEDERLATAAGLTVPRGLNLAAYDLSEPQAGRLISELDVHEAAPFVRARIQACGALPIVLQVALPDAGWAACPVGGQLEYSANAPGEHRVSFPLVPGCPAPTPTPSVAPSEPPPIGSPDPTAEPIDPEPAPTEPAPTEPAPTEPPDASGEVSRP
jgi:hypothetical protein